MYTNDKYKIATADTSLQNYTAFEKLSVQEQILTPL